jgi:hypothetical protein
MSSNKCLAGSIAFEREVFLEVNSEAKIAIHHGDVDNYHSNYKDVFMKVNPSITPSLRFTAGPHG